MMPDNINQKPKQPKQVCTCLAGVGVGVGVGDGGFTGTTENLSLQLLQSFKKNNLGDTMMPPYIYIQGCHL